MIRFFNKMKEMPVAAKAAMWFTICNIFIKGIGMISTPLFTRIMSNSEYGLLSLFLSYEHIVLILSTLEIHIGAYQKGLFKYKEYVKEFTIFMQVLINIITIIFFVFVFLFMQYICKLTEMTYPIIYVMFFYIMLYPSYYMWIIRKQKEYEYKPVVIYTIMYSLGSVIIPLFSIISISRTAEVKYISQICFSIIFCAPFFIKNIVNFKCLKQKKMLIEQWIYALKFQIPLICHSLSYYALSQADRIMIGKMVSKAATGYYSVAYSLASIVSLLQVSLNQVLTPWRYSKLEEKKYDEIKKNTNYVLLGISLIILLFIIVAPEIMRILFSTDYYEAVWSIPPISASMYFIFLYSIFVNMETFFEKTKYITYVSIICGLLNIILNYTCIEIFGYIVCGYTTLFSYVIFSIGHYFFAKRICNENQLDIKKVFDIKYIVIISLLVIVCSILMTLLYPYFAIRYAAIMLIVVILIIYKDKFLSLIRKRG